MLRWGLAMLRNCTAAGYAVQQEPHGAARRIQPRPRCASSAPRPASPTTSAAQGTLQLFRTQEQLDGAAKDVRCSRALGVPYEVLDRDGCIRAEPALGHVRDKFVGGLRLPGDETGDCFKFTAALGPTGGGRGVEFRYGTTITRPDRRRRPHRRRRDRRGTGGRRRLRAGARQPLAAAPEAARHRPAGLPGQGLLADRADHRPGRARPNRR